MPWLYGNWENLFRANVKSVGSLSYYLACFSHPHHLGGGLNRAAIHKASDDHTVFFMGKCVHNGIVHERSSMVNRKIDKLWRKIDRQLEKRSVVVINCGMLIEVVR
jgi:hypothetical protein